MARNLSLAIGRPVPSFSLSDVFGEVRQTLALIAAAGRVGSAVEARRAPDARDLKIAGLDKAAVLRPPYRF